MKHPLPSKRCINVMQNKQAKRSDITAAITISIWERHSFLFHLFSAHIHLDIYTQLSTQMTSNWFG